MARSPRVSIESMQDEQVTIVRVTATLENPPSEGEFLRRMLGDLGLQVYTATGSAKRSPGDEHDTQVGYELALSRAFRSLYRQLRDQAYKKAG